MRPTQLLKEVMKVPAPVEGFVGAIGNTPLIRLNRLSQQTGCNIYGKAGIPSTTTLNIEFMNPGGSVKDRAALYVVKDAEEKGKCFHNDSDSRIDKTWRNCCRRHGREHRYWIGACVSVKGI
jgi:hypothetical protein